jgi:hypothetical protein
MGGTHPIAGPHSRLTVIESHRTAAGEPAGGAGLSWVTVRLQTSVAYQDHRPAAPIRFVAISFHPCAACRYPAAAMLAIGAGPVPRDRVAVSTTLKLDSVVTASCRR